MASRPAPPYSASSSRLSRSASASRAHRAWSYVSATAPRVRAGLGTASGATEENTPFAASAAACCSSVKVKSTVAVLPAIPLS